MNHTSFAFKPSLANDSACGGSDPLFRKLARFTTFDEADVQAIANLTRRRRSFKAHDTIVFQDSRQSAVHVVLSGVAFRCRHLPNGRRQIFGFLFPGDLCDAHFVIANECDYSLCLFTDAVVAQIPLSELMSVMVAHPKIERALLMSALVDTQIMREWLVNVGQRDGLQRMAHFFCEMATRLQDLGLSNADGTVTIPVTQFDLADTLGMTPVHVNRVIQRLRRDGLLIWKNRQLTIINTHLLERMAGFDRRYLGQQVQPVCPSVSAYGVVRNEAFA